MIPFVDPSELSNEGLIAAQKKLNAEISALKNLLTEVQDYKESLMAEARRRGHVIIQGKEEVSK